MSSYLSRLAWNNRAGRALVVHCSDNRFQPQFHDFLKRGLNLVGDYFLVAVPGAAYFFTLDENASEFGKAGRGWVKFLQKKRKLGRVILIGHEGCSWYEHRSAGGSLPAREQQEADLRKVVKELHSELGVQAEAYFAALEDGRVEFRPL